MVRLRPQRELPKEQIKNNTSVDTLFGEKEPEQKKNLEPELNLETPEQTEKKVVVEKVEADGPDEATVRLQKQIEELKKAEEVQRTYAERMAREREDALRQARENAIRLEQIQKESQEQEETTIGAGIQAAKSEAQAALLALKSARDAGDTAAETEAIDRLTDAKANLRFLEGGKAEIEARKKAAPVRTEERRPVITPGSDADIESWGVPAAETAWVKAHREWASDPNKRRQLAAASQYLTEVEKIPPGNPQFVPRLEKSLGIAKAEEPIEPIVEATVEEERPSIVSAPVSRDGGSGGSGGGRRQIRLSQEQKDAARIAGVTEVEYAKQLMKMNEWKERGNYPDRQHG